jgi:hypothetical protein
MIALPTIFEINILEVWAVFTNPQIFMIQSGLPGAVTMSPNAITSLNIVTQMKLCFFFKIHIMQNKFSVRH